MEQYTDETRQSWLDDAKARSKRIYRHKARHPTLVCFIDSLYYILEQRLHPSTVALTHDWPTFGREGHFDPGLLLLGL